MKTMNKHEAFIITSRLRKEILEKLKKELNQIGDSFSISLFEQTKDKEMVLKISIEFTED